MAKAPKKSSFSQSGGALPSIVGSRYMFGSHAYCRWLTATQYAQPKRSGSPAHATRPRTRSARLPGGPSGDAARKASSTASAAAAAQRMSIASTWA